MTTHTQENTRPGLVSIGIPTYRRPRELRRTLELLCAQSCRDLEILVSDNASPGDETRAVVEAFASTDARVRYVRQPENRGPIANFQYVLEHSRGEFFMWAADDDWRAPTFVDALLNALRRQPEAALAFCDFRELTPEGDLHPDYGEHVAGLRAFTHAERMRRRWRYFRQPEMLGKANLFYSLMRREHLADFDLAAFARRHGELGVDMLFVFRMLGLGPLALVEERLYGCTVGNLKQYDTQRATERTLGTRARQLARAGRYCLAYARVATGPDQALIGLAVPFKFASYVYAAMKRQGRKP